MQGIVDSLIDRCTPDPQAQCERQRRYDAEKTYRKRAVCAVWRVYLGNFFPIPTEPVGEWDDCLDTWIDAPVENTCLAISQTKRRYGHLKDKRRKRTEICQFIGRVARFGYGAYGIVPGRDMVADMMAQQVNEFVSRQLSENNTVDRLLDEQVSQAEQMLRERTT